MGKMELCEECVCAPVCSIFRATGGLARCVMFRSSRVETKPIVHARWIVESDDKGWKKHSCSNCGCFGRTDINVFLNWDYCPHCGAQMDEEEIK